MSCLSNRNPSNTIYQDTMKFLVRNQFPVIMDKSIRYFASLPQTGIYRHFNQQIKPFMNALHEVNSRQYTMSGLGSLIDLDRYGNNIKRPSPQLSGTSCKGNSLCLESTCFGFTEGVVESNNVLNQFCWSLVLSCLKDIYYSDRDFERKMKQYFAMFFMQAPAFIEAYQRTTFLRESIKVVCTDKSVRFSGPIIGGANGIPLPFWIDPTDPMAFPDLDSLPAGTSVGGANLSAFAKYVAPRLFTGAFSGGMESVKAYGLPEDIATAKEQTASVQDKYMEMEMIRMLAMSNFMGDQATSRLLGDFIADGLFPTFDKDSGNRLYPITQEFLEASTIAGYVQKSNPTHCLAPYRAILFVPSNWKFDLVEPPMDNYSMLGLGNALDFRNNTPGVFPILSSSLFSANSVGPDGTVILGQGMGPDGLMTTTARGLAPRDRAIREAVRTELLYTYSSTSCENANAGQLSPAARPIVPQSMADGFALKSTVHVATDVMGTARPVLMIFRTDDPRGAKPIEVCTVAEVTVDQTGGNSIVDCCPGNQIYAILTFSGDVSSEFTAQDTAVYRTGASGDSFLVTVTAVSGNVVTITSAASPQVELPCCSGSPDDYGTRAELINTTSISALSATIMKAECTGGVLYLELFTPIANSLLGRAGTITLCNTGQVINVVTTANASGVFVSVDNAQGESCDVCADMTCSCYMNAIFALNALN